MNNLPYSSYLPIQNLAACFNNVTNSYKFYWFLSILEQITSQNSPKIPIKTLLARMIASVWYPINYFKISFGKQDRLGEIALKINMESVLQIDSKKEEVFKTVSDILSHVFDTELKQHVESLSRFVPYRFISPWFYNELRGQKDHVKERLIKELSDSGFTDKENLCLYRFVFISEECIEIQSDWFEYLIKHYAILQGFCLWHLLNYLQKHNPNVPNIAGKLFQPEKRDLKEAKNFWNIVFSQIGSIECIYSRQIVHGKNFSLDHFLPWRFVTHDLLWNIIPTPKHINSSKSDNLPSLDIYFDKFVKQQYQAFHAVASINKTSKLLEDYSILFQKENIDIEALSLEEFGITLRNTILPQLQIAKNMGFPADWVYIKT